MKVLLSWIRDFVDVPGTPEEIGQRMSMRGLALEGIERHGDEAVLDFDVTANRPDCLSIQGVAREIATAYGVPLHDSTATPAVKPPPAAGGRPIEIPVTIEEPELCARYVAAVADVTVGPSPDWMQARLVACGIRPISNVVDITNYVLLELGHPMHAFDLAKLRGPAIVVRRARKGERVKTLDGKDRALTEDMLVIADAERPEAVGGVMGGADSEVSTGTTQIVFEAAWFKPASVRATSRKLDLRTEASYRFERGADLTAPATAMERALELLAITGAGQARGPLVDCYPRPHEPRHLMLDAGSIRALLGMDVPDAEVEGILRSLGFEIQTLGSWQAAQPEVSMAVGETGRAWSVTVPGWRADVQRPVDLIEEVGRHHGFEHLPTTFPAVEEAPHPSDPRIARDQQVRRALLAMGFSEAISFAFIETAAAGPFADAGGPVLLLNPLSEKFTTMRPSLLPGLIDAIGHNRRHGRHDVRLFEIGTTFSHRGETRGAAVAWTGVARPNHWSGGERQVDFFDVKGVAERLAATIGVSPAFVAGSRGFLAEGRVTELRVDGTLVGVVGQLEPSVAAIRELPGGDPVYVAEFNLDALSRLAAGAIAFAKPLPRHPSVMRDVAILIDDTLSAETVRGTIRGAGPSTLIEVREFDRYQGKGIAEGKVSLALRLTFQAADRTLTDAEVHAAMQTIVAALASELGAIQR